MIATTGKVYEKNGIVYVKTNRPPVDNLSDDVTILWHDSRARTGEQNRKAWALMTEIAAFQGEDKETVYREQSLEFTSRNLEVLQGMLFHLSTATVSEASAFISMLVEIIIEYGIPTKEPLVELCEDVQQMVYVSLLNKKCAVCGRKADIHHCEGSTVGMGRNRKDIIHVGLELMPLCRLHHQECHNIGQRAFNEKYHLEGVIADEKLCKKVGLKYAS